MKNKFKKIISSLLIFSFLAAAFSVFSFAETAGEGGGSEGENTENLSVLYNRGYEEGWDWSNGFGTKNTNLKNNTVTVDREEDSLGKYNYFVRFEATSNEAATAGLNFGSAAVTHGNKSNVPGTVIELSLKVDDVATLGTIAYINTAVAREEMKLIDINKNGELVLFNQESGGNLNLGALGNEWVNLAFVFDWLETDLVCQVHVGYGLNAEYTEVYDLNMFYPVADDVGILLLYLGFPAAASRADTDAATTYGMSWCLDNLKIYQGVRGIVELDKTNYGSMINSFADKVIDIQESAGFKTKAQILEEALAMKVGVNHALVRNQRYPLLNNQDSEAYNGAYGAPVKDGDSVLIPLQLLLDYIGFPSYIHPDNLSFDITTGNSTTYMTIGRDNATVDGKRIQLSYAPGYVENAAGEDYLVIALEDVTALFPGWLAIYDDMGLVIIYEDTTPENLDDNAPIVNRNDDLSTMVDIMKKFVFDTVTDPEDKEIGYIANGTLVYEDTRSNTQDFTHPYLITDADTFAALKAKYALSEGAEGYDALLKTYLAMIIADADAIYASYAKTAGAAYAGLNDRAALLFTAPATADGYNDRGEMSELVEYTKLLPVLGFACQITGNSNYARLAYDISASLADWQHWGPGYITDCAEAVGNFAIGYDWLYNEYKALGLNTEALALAIYELGVHDGYVSSSGKVLEHARGLGDLSAYNTKTDSTNAISTSGMMIGALAILDYIGSENAPEKASEETLYLIGNNIQCLIQYGLDIYAPDGSYIESATYWEAAASAFFRMVMAIDSASGSDYGLMDTWGIDKTCYYAIHIEDSDGFIWNYHDDCLDRIASGATPEELASLNTDMFNFVGSYLGDANLLAVRAHQLKTGKTVTVYDLLFYPFDGIEKAPELKLDYHLEAIDGFVARSDWSNGAIYTGIMGGMNNTTHGHIDSGNFIYRNMGINWIVDLGTENPYINGYDATDTRYKYYRVNGEGQNVIIMTENTNINYGQHTAAGGFITATAENEYGSYAILDNSSVYLDTVSYAKRGVLITNDRTTVVLQDELSFVKVQTLAWVVHTGANVEISDDGRVAYLTQRDKNNNKVTVRATIVSQRPDFVFTEQDVDKPILSDTLTSNKITGADKEYSRKGISRLVITSKTISFDVAVVFEVISDADAESAVGYKWTPMVNWEPSSHFEEDEAVETVAKRGTPVSASIRTETASAENMLKRGTAFVDRFSEFYKALATVDYTLQTYSPERLDSALVDSYEDYLDCVDEYEEFYEYIVGNVNIANGISDTFCGIVSE